jgi:hypothetical protein
VVPKHRRSEFESALASAGAPADSAEFWPEAVGYGQAGATAGPTAVHARVVPAGNGYPAPNGYDGAAAGPGRAAPPDGLSWQEWQDWQDWRNWGPPPELHPDHPSAPVPRIQLPADYPPGPVPAPRAPREPDLPPRRQGGPARTRSGQPPTPDAGYDNGSRRLHAVPQGAPAADHAATALRTPDNRGRQFPGQPEADLRGPDWGEPTGFQRQQGPARRDAIGYQRQAGPGRPETTDYRLETGPLGPGPGPATGRPQNGRSPNRDSHWTAGQVLTLDDGQAVRLAQEAQDYAAGIREAAEREASAITQQATGEAAAIREAAVREAADLRARLDSMSGELGRVAAYVAENLAAPAMPATALAPPAARPALPAARPALPGTRTAPPDTRPPRPATRPARPDTRPARPDTRPAGPRTAPAKTPQKRPRQLQAMRVASYATATLFLVAVLTGATEVGLHGFKFFVFRGGGVGQTSGQETDQQFLARQDPAVHHVPAPKGRHVRKSHQTAEAHNK